VVLSDELSILESWLFYRIVWAYRK